MPGNPVGAGRYNLPDSRGRTSPHVAGDAPHAHGAFSWTGQLYNRLIRTIWKKVNFLTLPFVATNAGAIQILPAQPERTYFFLQTQSGVNQIVVNFGNPAGATGVIPVNGLIVGPYPGFYEPLVAPRNEVWVSASAPNTPGFLIYALNE